MTILYRVLRPACSAAGIYSIPVETRWADYAKGLCLTCIIDVSIATLKLTKLEACLFSIEDAMSPAASRLQASDGALPCSKQRNTFLAKLPNHADIQVTMEILSAFRTQEAAPMRTLIAFALPLISITNVNLLLHSNNAECHLLLAEVRRCPMVHQRPIVCQYEFLNESQTLGSMSVISSSSLSSQSNQRTRINDSRLPLHEKALTTCLPDLVKFLTNQDRWKLCCLSHSLCSTFVSFCRQQQRSEELVDLFVNTGIRQTQDWRVCFPPTPVPWRRNETHSPFLRRFFDVYGSENTLLSDPLRPNPPNSTQLLITHVPTHENKEAILTSATQDYRVTFRVVLHSTKQVSSHVVMVCPGPCLLHWNPTVKMNTSEEEDEAFPDLIRRGSVSRKGRGDLCKKPMTMNTVTSLLP
eukprot:Blabericola_migrator_1__1403@NODE_1365_length_4708_cov_75_210515_g917_i0_p2_GENE_NODE_1365_length_4708_cov_75_210515_g917_i0NODE_1365_length_4708_cov_75_210515_g917_i0_p2_ORF_typecomplete_len412_score38_17CxxCxxCC/PF03692_15/0_076_NODE_1365_length_4708_cov_75_210515_g917_i033594594